jgi:hypothetical protein
MFKCPNCNKWYMQYDEKTKSLVCYGRCHQVIEVPKRILRGNERPKTADLEECIDAFSRSRRRAR